MTHWRCQLGQLQELGQRSIEWACSEHREKDGPRGDANLMITWSCNPHVKTPIPKEPSKSGLIRV